MISKAGYLCHNTPNVGQKALEFDVHLSADMKKDTTASLRCRLAHCSHQCC